MFLWRLPVKAYVLSVCSCLVLAYGDDDIEVKYRETFYNEITEEDTPTPCNAPDLTKWDKIFSMLENSQMRENMLLQYADDIIKVEIGSLRAEMLRLYGGSCGVAVETAGRRMVLQLESRLRESLDRLKLRDQTSARYSVGNSNHLEAMLQQLFSAVQTQSSQLAKLEASCEMALLFPMRSRRIFTTIIPDVPLSLSSFTVCMWVKPTVISNKTVLLSYGNRRNPFEIQLLLGRTSALLTIGGEAHLVEARNVVKSGGTLEWVHLCGSWSSEQGLATLWAGGRKVSTTPGVAEGHVLPDGGSLQLGQERNGCCPLTQRFDPKLAFAGKMTGVNMWSRVLSAEEISQLATREGQGCAQRGNIVAWGVTEMVPHGGAQFIN
uniref:Pentraxin (PTX) domain-containing protein n=1 Tax=Mola mola TaxID=94237 RepID=A0A3Q4AKH5_MOLML